MRRTFISIAWTPGVDPNDAGLLVRTIEDIYDLLRVHFGKPGQFDPLPVVRVFGDWVIPAMPPDSVYSSMEWYIDRSMDDAHERILTSRYADTVRLEPWQASYPHLDLCLTDRPIYDDLAGDYPRVGALGFSQRGLVSLISTHRLGAIDSPMLRQLSLRHLFAHYVGQMLDAPNPMRVDHLTGQGSDPYCDQTCALRLTRTPEDAVRFGQQQASQGVIYCQLCQRDLVARLTGFHYGAN